MELGDPRLNIREGGSPIDAVFGWAKQETIREILEQKRVVSSAEYETFYQKILADHRADLGKAVSNAADKTHRDALLHFLETFEGPKQ